ncbi:MAG: bifunctional adenosylcobinamide kinase/adenosylcobinamide-phosphate guanylyltransferase [Proteobacteria bacterium]|nr:bifunctional adenosylcobinamide kinase/adenosylcobinamide-phosphate guanylyltransferase [Pseudomonadota bacterium]
MSIILYTGGMKSGKSRCAEERALKYKGKRLYVATAQIIDKEMEERVKKHRERRKDLFDTLEEPLKLKDTLKKEYDLIMIDCLTFWYNNLLFYYERDEEREKELTQFVDALKNFDKNIILVTNEVGWGVIPVNPLARQFIDFSGMANQRIQEVCHETYLVVSGLEVRLK